LFIIFPKNKLTEKMKPYEYDTKRDRKYSAKNNRYCLTNQTCVSNNGPYYSQTENFWSGKKQRKLTGLVNHNYRQVPGFPKVYTSGCPHNTANLYLNKKNFSYKKSAPINNNNYFDKEQLFQNMMKLQTSLNVLNQKYHKQKIENDKQAKEIERQNKFLNSMNEINYRKLDKRNTMEYLYTDNTNNENDMKESMTERQQQIVNNLTRSNGTEYDSKKIIKLNEEKYNLNSKSNCKKKFTETELKDLYNELFDEYKEKEKLLDKTLEENNDYIQKIEKLQWSNNTLISNLKRQMKKIESENEEKDTEIKTLRKNIKCSRYTELLKENEILNKELDKLKNKLNNALKRINDYKKQEEEIKKLYDVIKKRDFKIKALELKLMTLSNNADETTKKLQDEITVKDKLLKKQERDMKRNQFEKYALMQGQTMEEIDNKLNNFPEKKNLTLEMNIKDLNKHNPELYQLYIEMKHKGINSSKNFESEVLNNVSDVSNVKEAKIKYIDLVLEYFQISKTDESSKNIIFDLADKEFISNRSIQEIKNRHIRIFNTFFNKNVQLKSYGQLKKYIESNDLEELIDRTFKELDKNKLGYITFAEMKNAINDMGLNDFLEEILTLTKSEIFNRIDYLNLIYLNKRNENQVNVNNYIQNNKKNKNNEENNANYDDFNNVNNNANSNNNVNKIINEELEKKLLNLGKKIKKKGQSANNYVSHLKEENQGIPVISLGNLKEFLKGEEIELKEDEINSLKNNYGVNGDYIHYDNFVEKLLQIIQNISDNDDNVLDGIPEGDIAGV
jgi:hypothetical protein